MGGIPGRGSGSHAGDGGLTVANRPFKQFVCRRCRQTRFDFEVYGTWAGNYCLEHVPWWTGLLGPIVLPIRRAWWRLVDWRAAREVRRQGRRP